MLLSALACGPAGPGKFTGTVQGNALELKDALLVANTEIWLSNTKELCPKLASNKFPKNGSIVKLILRPVATGDFKVDPSTSTSMPNTATMQFLKLNDTCNNTLAFGASIGTEGTVTVTRYDTSQQIDGTFDMTFGDTDAATGSFSARYCNAPTLYSAPECVAVE